MSRCPRGTLPLLVLAAWCVLGASCSQDDASGRTGNGGANGRGSRPAKGGVFTDHFQRIRIEAEKATKLESDDAHPGVGGKVMRVVDDPGASGGKCIAIPDEAGTPYGKAGSKPDVPRHARAVYKFKVAVAGSYTFWCRRKWFDSCGDTLAMRLDKEGAQQADACLFGSDDSSKPPRWDWSPVKEKGDPRQFYLAAGEHTLEILNREDGPRFDVILLTDDPDYVPQGMED
ncbi:MAG TPA: hypothetical protein VNE39_06215 [Planctomycetota bacterium]|nr:hypothetical protein [Planctomycetota bacterium]